MNSIELLKAYGLDTFEGIPLTNHLISDWLAQKDFDPQAASILAKTGSMGRILSDYLLGSRDQGESIHVMNYLTRKIKPQAFDGLDAYLGTREQNYQIDRAVSQSNRVKRANFRAGACDDYHVSNYLELPNEVRKVPVAVIGNGAAGILAARAIRIAGFHSVKIFEKSSTQGIWSRANVFTGSRNNPVDLKAFEYELSRAPGTGYEVRDFLGNLELSPTHTSEVSRIIPSINFNHVLEYGIGEVSFPIVVNCTGIGTPRPANDGARMSTSSNTTLCGERWQRKLTVEETKGKHFTFIGLGNSTAEMLRQLHTFQDNGIECDYTILTHYPQDSVQNPDTTVFYRNRDYRMFRDTSVPNLTSYQGDLTDSRYDYFRALRSNKIITNVSMWRREGDHIVCSVSINNGGYVATYVNTPIRTDHLFTLIGYQPTVKAFEKYGIPVDADDQCGMMDYDGEVHSGEYVKGARLYKGYFCFGSCAVNPRNKNSIVIPGMLFRLHDLIPSICLRAAESVKDQL